MTDIRNVSCVAPSSGPRDKEESAFSFRGEFGGALVFSCLSGTRVAFVSLAREGRQGLRWQTAIDRLALCSSGRRSDDAPKEATPLRNMMTRRKRCASARLFVLRLYSLVLSTTGTALYVGVLLFFRFLLSQFFSKDCVSSLD